MSCYQTQSAVFGKVLFDQAFLTKRYLLTAFFNVEMDNDKTGRYRIFQLLIYAN